MHEMEIKCLTEETQKVRFKPYNLNVILGEA